MSNSERQGHQDILVEPYQMTGRGNEDDSLDASMRNADTFNQFREFLLMQVRQAGADGMRHAFIGELEKDNRSVGSFMKK